MAGVFISYRREDSSGYAGRLYDILVAHFGRENTFMDLDTIRGGDNFVTVIEDRIARSDVLLAVIGERWLTAAHDGVRRLDQPEDFVRLEIAKALERGVRVIPVLVGSATVPREQDLPADLRPLALRHAMDLRDAHFREDAQKLIELLDTTVPVLVPSRPKRRLFLIAPAATLLVATVLGATLLLHHKTQPQPQPKPATAQNPPPELLASGSASALAPKQQSTPLTKAAPAATSTPAIASRPQQATLSPAPAAPPTPGRGQVHLDGFDLAPKSGSKPATSSAGKTAEAAAQLSGTWKATVTYDWPGAVYPETFHFEVDGPDLSGTASLLQAPRAIVEGHISGDRITFTTKTQTELDDKIYPDKNNYKGTLTGDTIQFTMLTDSEASEHTPIHFTAHKLASKR